MNRLLWKSPWLWLLLALVAFGSAGCATSDYHNTSQRPWNAPQDWENGLPPEMYNRPY